ncbi:MAG: succinyldiaminopimelate transaminase [Gammaproteobacteria bacterium RIFCSPLOWO2_02_FULL_61_13]|nr:MAG: succinyldiaminopimelate transaminase [Gammaproteobacteria bacterium RIFCSPLOWO2_02_FULL_61_13]
MNPDLNKLRPYPFERLSALLAGAAPSGSTALIDLAIGEPKHATPEFILAAAARALPGSARYPLTRGGVELRQAAAGWLTSRFGLPSASIDPERQLLPVNGTREALFAFAQCVIDRSATDPVVLLPNPFYQIYEGAASMAGARRSYISCSQADGYRPNFAAVPKETWQHCQLLYLCSPNNPTGTALSQGDLSALLALSDRYGFIIAADECYSEIYLNEDFPPAGLLQAAAATGRTDFRNCMVFHSLSKRSNIPGMRSGFVAGDADLISRFHQYRTYHGCAMPPPIQVASIAAWSDEEHVRENRRLYREKFDAVLDILGPVLPVCRPEGGFYLWPRSPINDEKFAKLLYARYHVRVLPGSYLGHEDTGGNPGTGHVRIALVAAPDECVRAARHIRELIQSLPEVREQENGPRRNHQ